MSLTMNLITAALRISPTPLRSPEVMAKLTSKPRRAAPVPRRLKRRCDVRYDQIDGMRVITLTPKTGATGTHLLYIHGGAYVSPLSPPHWWLIGDLIRRTGATVTAPLYPLAPQHTAAEAFPKIRAVFERLQADGTPVFLAGDSSGGGLALSLALQLRDDGAPAPTGLLLFSPWVDVTLTNPAIPELEPRDPMLARPGAVWCGQQWASELSTTDPRISPLYGDLRGLPPMYIYQGGREMAAADSRRFLEKAQAAGSRAELCFYPGAVHVFVGVPSTPEARSALTDAASIINAPTAGALA